MIKYFKKHFENVFNDNDWYKQELSKLKELNQLVKATPDKDMKRLSNDFTKFDEIQDANKTLKKRKSPGCENTFNERLIYGGEIATQ